MNNKSLIRVFASCSLALAALCATGCVHEEDSALTLYYPEVSNIGPSMSFISGSPSYHGSTPSNYAITAVKLDGSALECQSFTINEASGSISISNTDELNPGLYTVSISCQSAGANYSFKDIFRVNMLRSVPEGLEVDKNEMNIPFSELPKSDSTLTVKPTGEHVSVKSFALAQESGKEYFSISKAGIIGVNANFGGEFLPGTYPISVKVGTYAGEKVYENIATIRLTSAPFAISYSQSGSVKMETGLAYTSPAPELKGSKENLTYALKAVAPSTDKITIDKSTGVISVAEGNGFAIGNAYVCDVTATNDWGTKTFDAALTINVIAFITPIDATKFSYEAKSTIQGAAFAIEKADGFVGDEVSFSFGTLPSALEGQITIDSATGTISAAKGNTIPQGSYEIPVKAESIKGAVSVNAKLTISENPYYFSYIRYGNNLGLPNDGTYANQFRYATSDEYTSTPLTPTTDAKAGTELVWSMKTKHQCGSTTIDPATGVLTMSGFKATNGGLILVTATAGKGEPGETSVTVPVFFSFNIAVNGYTVEYTPFVIQVNPRTGGTGVTPKINGSSTLPDGFLMDYRRTFNYYNFNGPASHLDGQPSVAGSFMNQMWAYYYFDIMKQVKNNTGARGPMSYYDNKANTSQALMYLDPSSLSLVVNPNRFIDTNDAAANGAMIAQMTFVTDGNSGGLGSSTNQVFPIWVWFDEQFK